MDLFFPPKCINCYYLYSFYIRIRIFLINMYVTLIIVDFTQDSTSSRFIVNESALMDLFRYQIILYFIICRHQIDIYILICLFRICRVEGCGRKVSTLKKVSNGGGLRVHMTCETGHFSSWESCSFYREVNLKLIILILINYQNIYIVWETTVMFCLT